jgi:hypothetical protein
MIDGIKNTGLIERIRLIHEKDRRLFWAYNPAQGMPH